MEGLRVERIVLFICNLIVRFVDKILQQNALSEEKDIHRGTEVVKNISDNFFINLL